MLLHSSQRANSYVNSINRVLFMLRMHSFFIPFTSNIQPNLDLLIQFCYPQLHLHLILAVLLDTVGTQNDVLNDTTTMTCGVEVGECCWRRGNFVSCHLIISNRLWLFLINLMSMILASQHNRILEFLIAHTCSLFRLIVHCNKLFRLLLLLLVAVHIILWTLTTLTYYTPYDWMCSTLY